MADQSGGPVRVKKVNPYPIPVQLGTVQGKIVKLAVSGFLVETVLPLKVNQVYQSQFVLPVMNEAIVFSGVVVKTYDRFRGELGESQANLKLAEITFKSLGVGHKEKLNQFLRRIGQKR